MAFFATIPRNPTVIDLKFPTRIPFHHLKLVPPKATTNNVEDSSSSLSRFLSKEPITRTNIHKPHIPALKLDREFIAMKA